MVKDIFWGLDLDFGRKCLRIKHIMVNVVSNHVPWAYQGVRCAYVVSSLIFGQSCSTTRIRKEYAPCAH